MNLFRAIALLFLIAAPISAAEPWADPNLKVQERLALWLDATRAAGNDPPQVQQKLAKWTDASAHGRHLTQTRPTRSHFDCRRANSPSSASMGLTITCETSRPAPN